MSSRIQHAQSERVSEGVLASKCGTVVLENVALGNVALRERLE